jgi:hypothetical protein
MLECSFVRIQNFARIDVNLETEVGLNLDGVVTRLLIEWVDHANLFKACKLVFPVKTQSLDQVVCLQFTVFYLLFPQLRLK